MSVGIAATYVALFALAAGQTASSGADATAPLPLIPAPTAASAAPTNPTKTPSTQMSTPVPTPTLQPPTTAALSEASPTVLRLLAGTVVEIELVGKVSSSNERIGDRFDLKLASPIVIDGAIVAPAGATGQGEVIDVAAAGIAGHPGKLILAARYVEANGLRIPLRGFKLAGEGRDNTTAVVAVGAIPYAGVLAFVIAGGNVTFPAGTFALAKVAADVALPANLKSEPNR